jgi:hypothetical protein
MSYRELTPNPNFSEPLNGLMFKFIDRLDMDARDREIFEDLALFIYHEGKLRGKEEYLNEVIETKLTDNAENENAH